MARTTTDGQTFDTEISTEEESFDFVKFYIIIRKLLPWMIISAILGALAGWLYTKYANPVYHVDAKILIKDNEPSIGGSGANASIFQSLGIMSGSSSVDNELQIIQSPTILDKVVRDLQLNISYKPVYDINPVLQSTQDMPWETRVLNYNTANFKKRKDITEYTLKVEGDHLSVEGHNDFKKTFGWNMPVQTPAGTLVFSPRPGKRMANGEWKMDIDLPFNTTDGLMERITSEIPNKQTSVISLSINAENAENGKRILDKLIDTYIADNVKDNNSINDSTMVFITERLGEVTRELNDVERSIQDFKQKNKITDITEQTKVLLDATKDNNQQLVQAEVQYDLVSSLENYLRNNQYHIVPSTLAQDPSLAALITQYNQLVVQRNRLAKSATAENPVMQNLESQISTIKSELSSSIRTAKSSAGIMVRQMQNQVNQNMGTITKIPAQERQFLDISRQQAIKQELYLFLLKKREETAIGKSSTISSIRVIDYGRINSKPVSPKKTIIMLAGLLLGAVVPLGVFYVRKNLNIKINSKTDIEERTKMPILGEIGHQDEPALFEVKERPRSPIAEQFRILRTNLHFYKKKGEPLVIMQTSSMPGEGKTFISLNLAATLAANKENHVLVIGFDLRKPQLAKDLKIHKYDGFTEYAVGEKTIEEVVYPVPGFTNLDVLPSGSIPPNPSELLMSQKTSELFEELRKEYDFIIVDCPPIVVTDYQIIGEHVDLALYATRMDYTEKRQIEMANEIFESGKLPRMSLVVNDFKADKYDSYQSNHYYQYGYYDQEEVKKPWWRRWF